MTEQTTKQKRMTELLNQLATKEGVHYSSILDGIKFMRASNNRPKAPVMYEPSIVFVGQGRKRGYLGNQQYVYDPHNYLMLTVPMPFECETEAGPDGPMLAFSIRIEVSVLNELLMKIDQRSLPKPAEATRGIFATQMNEDLTDAAVRLLECMLNPSEAKILGPQIMREITYRVLCGENGGALRDLLAINGKVGQLQRAIERMHADYAKPLDIETLADEAGISSSSFHHNFKALTATSPLQYLKTIRLHKAKMLMLNDGITASAAAESVGYESVSQFSREFKRFFGESPVQEIARMRELLGLGEPVLAAVD
ncbi:MAG TPA: AraC family transcriptional regulator [Planktothrix sp.]|jgi:AraC-like DNA-binding protein